MGSCISRDSAAETVLPPQKDKEAPRAQEEQAPPPDLSAFVLKKRRPGCNGMFWRSDPRGQEQLLGGHDWPQDNATLCGVKIQHEDEAWLKVYKVKQVDGEWIDVSQLNGYIPFEYDDHYYLDPVAN